MARPLTCQCRGQCSRGAVETIAQAFSRACLGRLLKIFAAFSRVFQTPLASGSPTNAQARNAWRSRPPRPIPWAPFAPKPGRSPWNCYPLLPQYALHADRPDQRIANRSGEEEAGKNIKDLVMNMIARNTFGHPRVVQIVDDRRAGDPRRRPGGEQTAMDRADVLRAECISAR